MEIIVSNRHFPVSNETKEYVTERIEGIIEGKTIKISSVRVVLDSQRTLKKAEIIIKAKNVEIEASDESYDMNASIDATLNKIETQLNRYIDKKQDHHKTPSTKDIAEKENVETDEEA